VKRIIALMAMVAVGLAVFLYPQAVEWNYFRKDYARAQAADQVVQAVEPKEVSELITQAQDYNSTLLNGGKDYREEDSSVDLYYQGQLRNGKYQGPDQNRNRAPRPDEAMGRVTVPKVNISLPVYHGATDNVLAVGAGLVYGTSLPVGGVNTHAVITAHSRQGSSGRFNRLAELVVGDDFLITTAGQTLRYVVDQISIVLPDDADALQIIPGEDHVTLLTCTPIGINSHRLLVRGIRADLLETGSTMPGLAPMPFAWWAVWFFGGILLAGIAGAIINKVMKPKEAAEGGSDDRQ